MFLAVLGGLLRLPLLLTAAGKNDACDTMTLSSRQTRLEPCRSSFSFLCFSLSMRLHSRVHAGDHSDSVDPRTSSGMRNYHILLLKAFTLDLESWNRRKNVSV